MASVEFIQVAVRMMIMKREEEEEITEPSLAWYDTAFLSKFWAFDHNVSD